MDTAIAQLDRLRTHTADDGRDDAIIEVYSGGAPEPHCVHANLAQISVIVVGLIDICKQLTKRIVASGKSPLAANSLQVEPLRVMSAVVGELSDHSAIALAVQTDAGPLVTLAIPGELARQIAAELVRVSEGPAGESKLPSLN